MALSFTENDFYKYLGLTFAILILLFLIHKIIQMQTRVIENMDNNSKSINELYEEVKNKAKVKRDDLHLSEDREKIEDIILSYRSIIGCELIKSMSTDSNFVENPTHLMHQLFLYSTSMDAADKLIKQVDRLANKSKSEKSTF